MGQTNENLNKAKSEKNDEFYTYYADVKTELDNYKDQLAGKIIYLPCDEPIEQGSEFWNYFIDNFAALQLKRLIATAYNPNGKAYKIYLNQGETEPHKESLDGNGDFRSQECIDILNESDIVVTNPPFSLFRDFVDWIMKADKQFLIIGSETAFGYQGIFRLIKDNRIWVGYNKVKTFRQPDGTNKKFGNIGWFTNLYVSKRYNDRIEFKKNFADIPHDKFDNYDAVNVDRVDNIPGDYYGTIGVPVTYLEKYNPEQFTIEGILATSGISDINFGYAFVNKVKKYNRVLIRRKG